MIELLEEFHRRQNEMYGGGSVEPVAEMLADDVVWHVPGTSAIAGDHVGAEAVLHYFRLRREIAREALALHPGDAVSSGDIVAQLVDGTVDVDGRKLAWRTVGVYRFDGRRVAEAWLVPGDLEAFDRIWSRLSGP